ncbi:MAG TPA: hypothetical protein PKZ36_01825 [Candidatus Paceibacterota bacterium]|mgnify:CR=1 FL=1|nr:hypothetical protein [Candidatus Paceibacterota bacterium]HPT18125.1 hypothetical protein [Candidatus Paceibacterota bacterium]
MEIIEYFDKDNLHHAYLIEGTKEKILPNILFFVNSLGIKTSGNPDFCNLELDSFTIEDARNLKSMGSQNGFSNNKKIFIISANNFLIEAQNTLLKIFEEPIENTHFFLIVPDANIFLPTLFSRFYFIKTKPDLNEEIKIAEEFISLSKKDRIAFLKDNLKEEEYDDDFEKLSKDSVRSKAIRFLNALEVVLHNKYFLNKNFKEDADINFFDQILKVRAYLNQPGSSMKNLMDSIALNIPSF